MGALAVLETRLLPVAPGSQVSAQVRVRNTGSVVDQFTFQILGDAQGWASVQPPTLSLFPGAEEAATVTFSPPRSPQVPAGQMPFGVHVMSKEDAAGSVVEEGVLDIAPFSDLFAELAPRTSRGSRSATHDLAIDNRGNAPLNATITAADPDRLLNFDLRPPGVLADPGTAAFAKVAVKPRKSFWRGPAQTRPFLVQVEPAGAPTISVDGTMVQEAILPPWFMRVLLAVVGLLVALVLLWVFFLRPTIESTAREQTLEVAEDMFAQLGVSPPPGGFQDPGAAGQSTPPAQATPTPVSTTGTNGSPSPGTSAPPQTGDGPQSRRIGLNEPVLVPDGKTLSLTDLVFSNPSATNIGELQLLRNQEVLMVLQMENFRDLDFHFVTPIVIPGGQQFSLVCAPGATCTNAGLYYSGFQR